MIFDQWINKIARITNKWLMLVLALLLTLLLFTLDEKDESYSDKILVVEGIWILFILLSTIFSLNGFLLNAGFKKEVKKFMKKGKNLRGIQGFEDLVRALKASRLQSYLITLSSIVSFSLFYIAAHYRNDIESTLNESIGNLVPTFALSMAFVAIAITFLVSYPEDPSLTPGGLIGFYEPDAFPLKLDNILSDVFNTYQDPVTAMKYDEWSASVKNFLVSSYENDEIETTRMERAREKILLLAYLSNSNPDAFTKDIVEKELLELFGDKTDEFIKGKGTGLTWKEIKNIIKKVEKSAPEPFRLVDRLLVNLTDNYDKFIKDDLYFTVSAKTHQTSVIESTGLIVFFINKTNQGGRKIRVWYETDINSLHPYQQDVHIELDVLTDPFPPTQPKLIDEGYDILSLLSSLLQVGDAIWFRLQPLGFGHRVVSIYAEEEGSQSTMGTSFEIRFVKPISWYLKSYGPKLSALGSLAMPFLGSLVGM
jgi:hypothetical protein